MRILKIKWKLSQVYTVIVLSVKHKIFVPLNPLHEINNSRVPKSRYRVKHELGVNVTVFFRGIEETKTNKQSFHKEAKTHGHQHYAKKKTRLFNLRTVKVFSLIQPARLTTRAILSCDSHFRQNHGPFGTWTMP